jgi:predicted site-specific integrase-resolvase
VGIKKPVSIRGVNYPSLKEAAASLGVSIYTAQEARRNCRLDYLGTKEIKTVSFSFKGTSYKSLQDASRSLGISFSVLQRWNKKGKLVEKLTEYFQE